MRSSESPGRAGRIESPIGKGSAALGCRRDRVKRNPYAHRGAAGGQVPVLEPASGPVQFHQPRARVRQALAATGGWAPTTAQTEMVRAYVDWAKAQPDLYDSSTEAVMRMKQMGVLRTTR